MSGQSTPKPKALVAKITRSLQSFFENTDRIRCLISDFVPAVNMSISLNGRRLATPCGSVMYSFRLFFIILKMLTTCWTVTQNTTVLGVRVLLVSSSLASKPANSSSVIEGLTIYVMLSRLGGKPITLGLFIDNFSTTQSRVSLVAVAVSAINFTCCGSRLLRCPIS